MKKLLLATLLAGTALLSGCMTYTPIAQKGVQSVLVVPVVNETHTVGADLLMNAIIPYHLIQRKGYYVFPSDTVRMVLENEGLYEPERIHQLGAQKLAEMFHADSVLFVRLKKWDAQYLGVTTNTVVDAQYKLYKSDGELLFETERSESELSNYPISLNPLDMALALTTAATARAFPIYEKVAREVNFMATIPWDYGFIHTMNSPK